MSCMTCGIEGATCCPPAANPIECRASGTYCSGNNCVSLHSKGEWQDACKGASDTTTCNNLFPGLTCVPHKGGETKDYPFGYWCDCGEDSNNKACGINLVCGGNYVPPQIPKGSKGSGSPKGSPDCSTMVDKSDLSTITTSKQDGYCGKYASENQLWGFCWNDNQGSGKCVTSAKDYNEGDNFCQPGYKMCKTSQYWPQS